MDGFDLNEWRAQRLRDLATENAMLAEQTDVLLKLLCAVLNMCHRSGHDWRLVLGAAVELEGVDPGRMARVL